jgi:dTDP-4-dehydrorhamnose reductase
MKRIVIAGSGGKLGATFVQALNHCEILQLGRRDFHGARFIDSLEGISSFSPDLVVNCAADTDVEGAQDNADRAYAANALVPELLGQAANRAGAFCVHFSSTGCYGEQHEKPYTDFEPLVPTTVHHQSKKVGEEAIRATGADVLILRLGWLFGGGGPLHKDFVRARLMDAAGKTQINADPHQIGNPTFVPDVVEQTLRLVQRRITGIFNCVNAEPVSRLGFVRAIFRAAHVDIQVVPRRFDRKAPVSTNESAVNRKLDILELNSMGSWETGLTSFVREISA